MDISRQLADQASKMGLRMLQHINQALASVDPQLVMSHVREAMEDGENLGGAIDEIRSSTPEGTVAGEKAEIASDHLREAMTEGGAALTASGDFIKSHVQSMREHVDEMMTNLNAAALPAGR